MSLSKLQTGAVGGLISGFKRGNEYVENEDSAPSKRAARRPWQQSKICCALNCGKSEENGPLVTFPSIYHIVDGERVVCDETVTRYCSCLFVYLNNFK